MEFTKAAKFIIFFFSLVVVSFVIIGSVLIFTSNIFFVFSAVLAASFVSFILYSDIVKN